MDKFEQKEMKRIRPIKNTLYYWLINYICDMGEQTAYGRGRELTN